MAKQGKRSNKTARPRSLAENFEDVLQAAFTIRTTQRTRDNAAAIAVTAGVRAISFEDEDTLIARVRGTNLREYAVQVYSDYPDGVMYQCECNPPGMCEHLRAVLLRILAQAAALDRPWTLDYVPVIPHMWRKIPAQQLPALEGNVFERLGLLPDTPRGKTKPRPEDGPWWEAFVTADAKTKDILLERVVRRSLGAHARWAFPSWNITEIAHEPNPFEALRRFRKAMSQAVHRSYRSEPFDDTGLAAYLASDAARAGEDEYVGRLTNVLLGQWLEQGAAPSTTDADIDVEFAFRDTGKPIPALAARVLLSSKRLDRAPRNPQAILTLIGEVRAGRKTLPTDAAAFVTWLADLRVTPVDTSPTDEDKVDLRVENPVAWSAHAPPGRLRWADTGTPVRIASSPARVGVTPEEGFLFWTVLYPGECDNAQTPIHHAALCAVFDEDDNGVTGVWARHGDWLCRVHAPDMPLGLLMGLTRRPKMDPGQLRGSPLATGLFQRLSSVPESRRHLTSVVPVKPGVALRIERNMLSLVATAEAEDGQRFVVGANGVWAPTGKAAHDPLAPDPLAEIQTAAPGDPAAPDAADTPDAAEANPHAIVVTPDPKSLAPLEEWLDVLVPDGARWGAAPDGLPARMWRLTPDLRMELFLAWGKRPRGVACLGDRAVRDLLSLRQPPRFRIEAESSGVDWLSVSVSMETEMEMLPLDEVRAALAGSGQLVSLPRYGTYQRDELESYARQVESIADAGLEIGEAGQRLHMMQLAGANLPAGPDMDAVFAEFNARAREVAARFKGVPKAKIAPGTAAHLRPYQRTGADFLVWSAKTFGGAILADDMGLGKTLQVLAAMTALRAGTRKKRLPALVVCPASVAHNWQREAARFAPDLKTVVIERGVGRREVLDNLGDYDLVIKNYALTRRDAEHLQKQEWLLVCVDEAQAIKNPEAEISKVVKSLDARHRIALTGTPIENRLTDLWSIADFAAPGYLGTQARFEAAFAGGDAAAAARLRARLRPVLLRRLKAEVAPELPPRIEERLDCAMTPKQRTLYLAEMKRARDLLRKDTDKRVIGKQRIEMLAALTRLRQLCCDPGLRGAPEAGSGKVEVLMEMLPPLLEAGHKVLIFSQFVQMLRILEKRVAAAGIPQYLLTGQTTKRQELVDRFEADPDPSVFLISLKAGGAGLNLVSASHVVLFDPWWNPAVEAQAIDRTHRIGQDKTVIAFRLVAQETIEERILELQEKKRDLVKGVLEADNFNRSLSREDFEFLLAED